MTFRELTIDNPLMIEYRRSVRRFFGVSKHSTVNAILLVISCLLYGLLLLITIMNRTAMHPAAILYLQTFLFCFLIPANLHGAIAGERERRSWDLLLAAPITNLQIVVGKLMSGIATIATAVGLMLPPLLIAYSGDSSVSLLSVIKAESISIGFALCLAALTLFVSARSKRTFSAQLTTYALLVLGLIVYMSFVSLLGTADSRQSLLFLHPFYAITQVWWPDGDRGSGLYNGLPHLVMYLGIAAVLVAVTVATLQAADGEEGRAR